MIDLAPCRTVGPALAVPLIFLILTWVGFPEGAAAQSYNCAQARLPAEVAICRDFTLSGLDSQMAGLYTRVVSWATSATRTQIQSEQREWLASRNQCGADYQCLIGHYNARIMGLGNWWQALGLQG
jgi:uncharacterized protein